MLLNIITITYNNIVGLQTTIDSINYNCDIRHIIIDGNSTDGTLNYLKTLDQSKIEWISESDNGIYDAMNKGLKKVNEGYVIFMNSGDSFYDIHTLPTLLSVLKNSKPDVLYGETLYVDNSNNELGLRSQITTRKLPERLTWQSMKKGMVVCHQSFIVKSGIAPEYIPNNLSADIDWIICCLKKSTDSLNFQNIIARYLIGGVSKQKHRRSLLDRFKIMIKHYGLFNAIVIHIYFIIRALNFNFKKLLK